MFYLIFIVTQCYIFVNTQGDTFMKIADFFYTETEAAKVLNVNRITVWRWINNGRFDVQRVGGVVFIPKDEVELVKKGGTNAQC